jgi:hypothetical protein
LVGGARFAAVTLEGVGTRQTVTGESAHREIDDDSPMVNKLVERGLLTSRKDSAGWAEQRYERTWV